MFPMSCDMNRKSEIETFLASPKIKRMVFFKALPLIIAFNLFFLSVAPFEIIIIFVFTQDLKWNKWLILEQVLLDPETNLYWNSCFCFAIIWQVLCGIGILNILFSMDPWSGLDDKPLLPVDENPAIEKTPMSYETTPSLLTTSEKTRDYLSVSLDNKEVENKDDALIKKSVAISVMSERRGDRLQYGVLIYTLVSNILWMVLSFCIWEARLGYFD